MVVFFADSVCIHSWSITVLALPTVPLLLVSTIFALRLLFSEPKLYCFFNIDVRLLPNSRVRVANRLVSGVRVVWLRAAPVRSKYALASNYDRHRNADSHRIATEHSSPKPEQKAHIVTTGKQWTDWNARQRADCGEVCASIENTEMPAPTRESTG